MPKIEKFKAWAKQFIAIQDSHVREFLDSVEDLSLHEMKRKFSDKYQDRIAFSYLLQAEKKIVRNLHIKPIKESDCFGDKYCKRDGFDSYSEGNGSGYSYDFGNYDTEYDGSGFNQYCGSDDGDGDSYGDYGTGDPDGQGHQGDVEYGNGYMEGDGDGHGREYDENGDNGAGDGRELKK